MGVNHVALIRYEDARVRLDHPGDGYVVCFEHVAGLMMGLSNEQIRTRLYRLGTTWGKIAKGESSVEQQD